MSRTLDISIDDEVANASGSRPKNLSATLPKFAKRIKEVNTEENQSNNVAPASRPVLKNKDKQTSIVDLDKAASNSNSAVQLTTVNNTTTSTSSKSINRLFQPASSSSDIDSNDTPNNNNSSPSSSTTNKLKSSPGNNINAVKTTNNPIDNSATVTNNTISLQNLMRLQVCIN